eukprot:365047-Chlamydomonas_euryale.AAC.13
MSIRSRIASGFAYTYPLALGRAYAVGKNTDTACVQTLELTERPPQRKKHAQSPRRPLRCRASTRLEPRQSGGTAACSSRDSPWAQFEHEMQPRTRWLVPACRRCRPGYHRDGGQGRRVVVTGTGS